MSDLNRNTFAYVSVKNTCAKYFPDIIKKAEMTGVRDEITYWSHNAVRTSMSYNYKSLGLSDSTIERYARDVVSQAVKAYESKTRLQKILSRIEYFFSFDS